jgi:uncharacterized delta-60 repeat protein
MWFLSTLQSKKASSPRSRSFRPQVQALEDRCLLSAGALDPTFAAGAGYATTSLSSSTDSGRRVLLQPSGTIVVAGQSTLPYTTTSGHKTTTTNIDAFGEVAYNPDGSLDTAFGSGGVARQWFQGTKSYPGGATFYDAALEPTGATGDDKILLTGQDAVQYGMTLLRLNADGSLDTTFGSSGQVSTLVNSTDANSAATRETARGVTVTASGQIVAAGDNAQGNWYVVRYNPNGSLDTTFGSGGRVTTTFGTNYASIVYGVVPQADGRLVVLGRHGLPLLARYNADGSLDATFGNGGIAATAGPAGANPSFLGAALDPATGKLVLAGSAMFSSSTGNTYQPLIERLNANGSLDTSFGNGAGFVTLGSPQSSYFGVRAAAVASDGRLIVAGAGPGNSTELLARLNTDGSPDTTFGNAGVVTTAVGQPMFNGVAIQANGGIVAAGQTVINGKVDFMVARYLPSEPQIGSFTANPDQVTAGSSTILTVSNLSDGNAGSTITQVAFYANVNGVNTLLGYATQTSPGVWTLTSTVSLAPGSYTLTAQAQDSYGVFGDPLALTLHVM